MKIQVFFKNYNLGELTQQNNQVLYNSNLEGEKQFKQNCFSQIFYPLFDSSNKKLETFPNFLQDYVKLCNNHFLSSQANIQKEDDTFTKLYKLSKLNFDDLGFYIKAD